MFAPGLAIFYLATILRLSDECGVRAGFSTILSAGGNTLAPARAKIRRSSLFYSNEAFAKTMALRTVSSWMKMMTSRVGGIVLVSRNIPDNIILDFTITSWLTQPSTPCPNEFGKSIKCQKNCEYLFLLQIESPGEP
jgi:hypothetical protein